MAIPENMRESIAQRFWRKVRRGEPNECWIWQGAKWNTGYGIVLINGKRVGAHRAAYFLTTGKQPGEVTMHTCDTPLCVNPNHLKNGTHLENMNDCTRKGRRLRHGQNGRAKLSWQKVTSIRDLYTLGFRQKELTKHFDVSQRLISLVVRNELWVGGCANPTF